jgi:hypothetical protein
MVRMILVFIIGIALSGNSAFGQVSVTVLPPASVGACQQNNFGLVIDNSGGADTLKISSTLSSIGNATCAISSQGVDFRTTGTVPSGLNVLKQGDSLIVIFSNNFNDTLFYNAFIDCHIIPDSSSTTQIDLTQQFSADSITVTNGTSNSFISPNLRYPYIREINPTANMDAWYLTDSVFTFYYQNTKNTSASILFTFQYDTSEYCHQIETDFVTYKIGVNGSSASYVGPTPVTLNFLDTLFVQQHVSMDTCLTTCPEDTAIFSWTCNYNQATLSSFCEACQNEYVHVYDVKNEDNLSVDFIRIVPSDPIYDFSCMNDTAGVWWEYQIVNDGVGAIDTLQFYLTQDASIAGSINFLSLLPISSITINRNSGYLDTLVTPKSQWLCTNLVSDALYSMKVVATDFTENDTIFLRFKTIRCSEELDTLLDKPKFYNQWSMDSIYLVSICGSQKVLGQTGDLLSSDNNIAGQGVGSNYDVDLLTSFYPTVSDLTFDTTYGGQNAWFDVGLHSALSTKQHVYQLLGCNGTNTSCDTLYGWLRAQIQTDPNLHLLAPSLDAFLQKVDLVTGDTTFIVADWWYSAFDSTDCTNHTYNYYFNLNQPLMRNFLDSGSFVFNLTACCATDTSPTPYAVAFYLLADPLKSCFTVTIPTSHYSPLIVNDPSQQWLPLSDEGSGISVHCPGCLAPGIIVDYYKMQRNSFGLQDSDNDGRADSLNAVIDPSGSWFAANKNKLNTNFSGFGDRVEDLLTAHLQAGDPGSGGYSYVQMQQPPLNLRFNALQVGREIPMALDTMRLLPDSLFFYVDSPTNTPGGCFECEMYGMDVDSFTTQLKIVATGADIFNHFLDTIAASNLYLFSFVDTVGGNLNSGAFDDTIPLGNSFNGFFEGQYYRLRVTYNVCGNFTGGNGTDVEDFVKKTDILNRMWVSGKVQNSSSIPQMYNDIATLHDSLSIGVDTSDIALGYSLMDTSYVNNYLFYCETRGSIHYFMSNDVVNGSSIVNTPGCKKDMQVYATSKIAGGKSMFDAYPYEYRPPALGLISTNLIVPTDYYISKASTRNYVNFINLLQDTDSIGIGLSDTTGTIFLDGSNLPILQCLTQSVNPSGAGQTPFAGDQLNIRVIDLELLPLICDPSTAMPPDSSIVTHFDLQQYPCLTQVSCSLPDSISLITATTAINMLTNNPQLTISTPNPVTTASEDTLCWDIKISNVSAAGVTQANFVYVAISDLTALNFLNNWHFYPSGSTTAGFLDGTIVPVISALNPGVAISGQLCAALSNCPPNDSLNFAIHYGWNCGNYPTSPYDSTAICEYSTFNLGVAIADTDLGSIFGKRYESPYTLCSTISLTTCFQSNEAGFVYPYQIVLDSLAPGLQIVSGSMSADSLSAQLTPTLVDSIWTIHPDSIALLYPTGGFNLNSLDLCFTFEVYLGCAYAGSNYLPNKTLFATTFCGDTIDAHIDYSPSISFAWNDSTICDDCFALDKFTVDSLAYTGTSFTYFIAACNYSSDTNTVSLVDLLPPGFTPSTPLPIITTLQYMECDTFAVTGIFSQDGTCPDMMNTALLIHDNDTLLNDSVCVEVISTSAICQDAADTVWNGTVNSNQLQTTFSIPQVFYIADSLVVSDTLRFLNCQLIMAAGSSINILNSGTLILNETTVIGCDTMWQGINVSLLGRLFISENSLVADANIAVTARNKTIVSIINSNLLDNVRNVFIPITSGTAVNDVVLTMYGDSIGVLKNQFLPRYNGQAAFGSIPMSGVETNRWVGTIGTTGLEKNVFFNMMRGIVGKVSSITCENNDFIDMIKDITAPSNLSDHGKGITMASDSLQTASNLHVKANNYFYNNLYGVYTARCNTTVRGVLMDTVRYGVHVRNSYLSTVSDISANTINAYFRGIDLLNNAGSGGISVRGNFINVYSTLSASAAIYLSENTSGNARYTIDGNIIDYKSSYGIVSQNAKYVVITENVLTQPSFTQSTSNYGILLNNADTSVVSCNSVTSANNPLYTYSTGIDISLSDKTTITCNTTSGHHKGIFFGGGNAETDFRGNTIGIHYVGLYLNSAAVISQQPPVTIPMPEYHGNVWLDSVNYLSGYGAVNLNDSVQPNLQASLFSTNQSVNFHNPFIPLADSLPPFFVDDGPWFNKLPGGSSFDCSTYLVCGENSLTGGEQLRMQIVNDETITSDFIPESKFIAKQQLFETFVNDAVLAQSKPEYIYFMDDQSTTSIGTLFQTDKLINEAVSLGSFGIQFDELHESLMLATDSINILDSLIANNMQAGFIEARILLIEQVSEIQSQLELEIASKEQFKNQKITAAISANLSVVPIQIPDENEKNVNDAYLAFETGGIAQLESRYSQLLLIANQCKFKGGPAVIRARNLLHLLDETLYFDDNSICAAAGIYRNTAPTSTSIQSRNKISVQPNPAKNSFEVLVDLTVEETILLTVMDILGNVVYWQETTLTATSNPITISSEQLPSAVYTLTAKSRNINYTPVKIIIIK